MQNKRYSAYVRILLIGLIAAGLLSACQSVSTPQPVNLAEGTEVTVTGGEYTNVNPDELATMLENKDFTLINVHIPFIGDIPHTDLSIPYDQVEQAASQLPAEKNAKIVLYCSSGHMSDIAAKTLIKMGYTNIWNLAGGMSAWLNAGYALQN